MRIVVDTCVVLDAVMVRGTFYEDAKKVLETIAEGKAEGVLTVKSLADIHYVLKHTLHDEQKTRKILRDILVVLNLTDSTAPDAIRALSSEITDYEDALLSISAASINADLIVTRNLKDYKKSAIKAVSPKEYLNAIQ